MSKRRLGRRARFLTAAVLVAVVAFAVYGFTAANTVPASKAGDGAGAITGYTVSAIAYTLNGTDPSDLDQVDFDLDVAAGTVEIKLVAAGSNWYSCTDGAGFAWSCDTTSPQATVATADELQVVSVE